MAAEPIEEELEPLFDYTRVQPVTFISLDDDDDDDDVRCLNPSKRSKSSDSSTGEKVQVDAKVVDLDNGKDDDDDFDWLNPPKLVVDKLKLHESSTVKEIRRKQQELLSITESAKAIAQEDNVKRDLKSSMDFASESPDEKPLKPAAERSKIVISIQDKDGQKQFRVYTDDKFERLFKMYADKAKLKVENLVFCFDGDKVDPTATPSSLEMEYAHSDKDRQDEIEYKSYRKESVSDISKRSARPEDDTKEKSNKHGDDAQRQEYYKDDRRRSTSRLRDHGQRDDPKRSVKYYTSSPDRGHNRSRDNRPRSKHRDKRSSSIVSNEFYDRYDPFNS